MSTLKPKPGFDWSRVNWGGPDQRRTDRCSYCDKLFPDPYDDDVEDFVPLIMWNKDGWAAEFCEDCQREWWGLRVF
jgi:uncharacterized protein with PIN domain